jgi:hypothetical protein
MERRAPVWKTDRAKRAANKNKAASAANTAA